MTCDEFNDFCRSLPATSHVRQWGDAHVWKVGGKVFAIAGWGDADQPAFTFKATDLNFEILRDEPGFRPAPYLASRGLKWIQQVDTSPGCDGALRYYLGASHRIVAQGLSRKKQRELGLQLG